MTEASRKSTVNKILKAEQFNESVREKYKSYWITTSIICTSIALTYFIFYSLIHATCEPQTFAGWLLGLIFVDVIATCYMISRFFTGKSFKLQSGQTYNSPLGIILKVLCLFDSMVPMMYLVYYFNYDPTTDTCGISVWKIIIYAPILFGALVLAGAFMGTKGPYSTAKDSSGNDVMTKADWYTMRTEQSLAGIDPDRIPVVLSPEQIKSMTKSDWYQLGMDLELAGYKVFRNSSKN